LLEGLFVNSSCFGFNGKENDREWGNQLIQDYGFRLYNPAIGKFLSVDPLSPDYPWNSTYAFAEGDVIRSVDLDGLEKMYYGYLPGNKGKTLLKVEDFYEVVEMQGGLDGISKQVVIKNPYRVELSYNDWYYDNLIQPQIEERNAKIRERQRREFLEGLAKVQAKQNNLFYQLYALSLEDAVAVGKHIYNEEYYQAAFGLFLLAIPGKPAGFVRKGHFKQFGTQMQAGLSTRGYQGAKMWLQGSAARGYKHEGKGGAPFDASSDFDVAIVQDDLWTKASDLGLTDMISKSKPIEAGSKEATALGIDDLLSRLSDKHGRPVNIKIYKSKKEALHGSPESVEIPTQKTR